MDPVDGIAPGVPDCMPEPPPMLPLGCDAPIAPVVPAPPADCAIAATGANAIAAATIVNFRMILSAYIVCEGNIWRTPVVPLVTHAEELKS